MLTVKLVYNEKCKHLVEELTRFDGYCFNLETYDEEHYKERKLGFKIKGSCGAKELPFIAVYDKGELVKAFYTEANECNLKNILEWIRNYLMEHANKGHLTITKIEGVNNETIPIGDVHSGYTKNFVEGLPLFIGTFSRWYRTSNVVEIDWENERFKTKNSTYSFEFNASPSN